MSFKMFNLFSRKNSTNLFKNLISDNAKLYRNCRNVFSEPTHMLVTDPNAKVLTMADVKDAMIQALGIQTAYTPLVPTREHLLKYEPASQSQLPTRNMQDSFTSAVIPLSTDIGLQNKYATYMGNARLGRLMEDLDLFAVWVLHKHVNVPDLPSNIKLPYTFVTALVDKIDFTDVKPKQNCDIRLSGHVSWVGKSSAEIVIWLEQNINGRLEKITRALFLMAVRNATNTKSAVINQLIPRDEKEKQIFDGGPMRKKRRIQIQNDSPFKNEPNDFEQKLIHDLYVKTIDMNDQTFNKRVLPAFGQWMEDTRVSTVIFPYPEDRNAHNKVFGGFLMRHALELSWAVAHRFGGQWPNLKSICDIAFHSPVDISSHIKFESFVVYTQSQYIQVAVVAHVFHPVLQQRTTTNVFYYTYHMPENIQTVVPRSYTEAMWYLEGRRKFNHAMGLSESSSANDILSSIN